MAENKYTILISGVLDPKINEAVQRSLNAIKTLSIKVTNVTIDPAAIATLKNSITTALNSASAGALKMPTGVGVGVDIDSTSTVAKYENIVRLVNEATQGAQARIRVEENANGVATRVVATYNDLNNVLKTISWTFDEQNNMQKTGTTYVTDNVAKQKEHLKIIQQTVNAADQLRKAIKGLNPLSAEVIQGKALISDMVGTANLYEDQVTKPNGQVLDAEQITVLKDFQKQADISRESAVSFRKEVAGQQTLINRAVRLAGNLQADMSTRSPGIPQVQEATRQQIALTASATGYQKVLDDGLKLNNEEVKGLRIKIAETEHAKAAVGSLGKDTESFSQQIGIAIKRTIEWSLAMGLVYGAMNQVKKGIAFINDLDASLTSIQLVTGQTTEEVRALGMQYNVTAKELGSTTEAIAKGSLEFIRQGKTIEETNTLIKVSTMQAKLANMDAAQSTEYITSIMNGFKLEATDMMGVLDKLVALDNSYATSVAEIATAMQRSSASANLAGVSLDELASYITIVSSVSRQSAESIGESFKTIFARMQAVKVGANIDEEGEDISNVEKVLRKYDITLRESTGEFRDLSDVLDEIAGRWQTFGSVSQSEIASTIAGVRQRERLLVLFGNYNKVLEAQNIALDASGLAQERYGLYLDSVAGKQQAFKATWESFWLETLNSNATKTLYDLGSWILRIGVSLGGLMPILTGLIGLVTLFNAHKFALEIIGIASNISKLKGIMLGVTTAIEGMTTASITMTGVMGWIGLIAVIGTAIYQLAKYVDYVQSAAQEQDKFNKSAQEFQNATSDYAKTAENYDSLRKLLFDYDELKNKVHLTAEESQKYLDIQKQIKDILPDIAGSYDDAGKFMLSSKLTSEDILAIQKQITDEQRTQYYLARDKNIEDLKTLIEAKKRETGLYRGEKDYATQKTELDAEIASYKELQALAKDAGDMGGVGLYERAINTANEALAKLKEVGEGFKGDADWQLLTSQLREAEAKLKLLTAGDNMQEQAYPSMLGIQVDALIPKLETLADVFKIIGDSLSGDDALAFNTLSTQLLALNKSFEEGEMSASSYFDILEEKVQNADLVSMFDDNTEAAQKFFTALFSEGASAIDALNQEFQNGDISVTDYLDGLTGSKDMLDGLYNSLIENKDAYGLNQEAVDGLTSSYNDATSAMQAASQELANMGDTADLLQQGYDSVLSGDMFAQFNAGAETALAYFQKLSEAAWAYAQNSGFAFKDSAGNALKSAEDIYKYVTGGVGNFSNFATQMTERVSLGVKQQNEAIRKAMVALGTVIGSFKVDFKVTTNGMSTLNIPIPSLLQGVFKTSSFPINIPNFSLNASSSMGTEVGNALGAVFDAFQPPAGYTPPPMDNSIWSQGNDSSAPSTPSSSGSGTSAEDKARNEAEKSYQDLLKMTISMLKDRANQAKKALKEELDAYTKLIKAKKDELDLQVEERKNKKDIEERVSAVDQLEAELAQIQFDTSEEGVARRLELEQELADAKTALEDEQFTQSIDSQKAALDQNLQDYQDMMDLKMVVLDDYLSQEGAITQEAMALIQGRTGEFYDQLMQWNMTYGSGVANDVVNAWAGAITWIETFGMKGAAAVANFAGSASTSIAGIDGQIAEAQRQAAILAAQMASLLSSGVGGGSFLNYGFATPETHHSGGIVGGIPQMPEQEVLAKLLKGEVVASSEDAYNFVHRTLPNIVAGSGFGNGGININLTIPVNGNLDKTVLPDIKKAIADFAMEIRQDAGLRGNTNLNAL